ncbi:hypothetical protein [Pontimicrobium sp. IMCC45349]
MRVESNVIIPCLIVGAPCAVACGDKKKKCCKKYKKKGKSNCKRCPKL